MKNCIINLIKNYFTFLYGLFFFIVLFFSFSVYSKKNIVIKGNEFVDDEIINSIVGENIDYESEDYVNIIIKSLNDTGNFKNIEI